MPTISSLLSIPNFPTKAIPINSCLTKQIKTLSCNEKKRDLTNLHIIFSKDKMYMYISNAY